MFESFLTNVVLLKVVQSWCFFVKKCCDWCRELIFLHQGIICCFWVAIYSCSLHADANNFLFSFNSALVESSIRMKFCSEVFIGYVMFVSIWLALAIPFLKSIISSCIKIIQLFHKETRNYCDEKLPMQKGKFFFAETICINIFLYFREPFISR